MTIIDRTFTRWTDPNARPLFKGQLISEDGCCCAQGDILRTECGWSDERLADTKQYDADLFIAKACGISIFHAILLRHVNDSDDGCPEKVLIAESEPAAGLEILGPQHAELFALGRVIDTLTRDQLRRLIAARNAVRDAASDASMNAAWIAALSVASSYAARDATLSAVIDVTRDAALSAVIDGARDAETAAAWLAVRDRVSHAARDVAVALIVRDLIGQHRFTHDHYDTLTKPWRTAIGSIHPDDED